MSTDRGVYVGMRGDGRAQTPVFYPGERHVLTLGPNGSGKGMGLIVPNLATLKRSILVIDPKGEACAITAERRRAFGDVFVFNPFGVLMEEHPDLMRSCGFNPLLEIDPRSESFAEDAMAVAEAYVVDTAGTGDKHWVESARDLVAALVMFECLKPAPSLGGVRDMLALPYMSERDKKGEAASDPVADRVMPALAAMAGGDGAAAPVRPPAPVRQPVTALNPQSVVDILRLMERSPIRALRNKAQRYMEGGTELRGVLAGTRTQTQSLDSMRLRMDLQRQRPFLFERMKERITTVYVVLPAHELHKHSRWLRLVVGSALRAMLKTPPSGTVGRVLFLLDEFAALGRFGPIEEAMGYARGYGLQIWPVLQDLVQLKRDYPKGWESFIAACGALTAYAPQDWTTAEYLAKLCGQRTIEVQTVSQDKETLEWRPTIGPQGFPLFRPEELMGMADGELLCRLQGLSGFFKTRGAMYTQTPFYQEGRHRLPISPYYKPRR